MTCGDPPPLAWVFRSHLEPPPPPWFVGPEGDTRSGSATLWVRWLRIGPGAARLPDEESQERGGGPLTGEPH